MESQPTQCGTIPYSLPTVTSITSSSPTKSTLTPHSDSSHCHTHSSITSTAVDSTSTTSQTTTLSPQTTPTNSHTTPISSQTTPTTGTLTPLPGTPPRKSSPNQTSLHHHFHQPQEVEEHDREIQETALLLASMTGPQNTLSPLKYLTQQQQQQPSATDTSGGGNKSVVVTAREREVEGGSISENRPVSGLCSSVAPSTCGAGNVASGGHGGLSRSLLTGPSGDGVKVPHGIAELSTGDIEGLPGIENFSPAITVVRIVRVSAV